MHACYREIPGFSKRDFQTFIYFERHALQYIKYKPTTCTNKNLLTVFGLTCLIPNQMLNLKKRTFLHAYTEHTHPSSKDLSDSQLNRKEQVKTVLWGILKQYK